MRHALVLVLLHAPASLALTVLFALAFGCTHDVAPDDARETEANDGDDAVAVESALEEDERAYGDGADEIVRGSIA